MEKMDYETIFIGKSRLEETKRFRVREAKRFNHNNSPRVKKALEVITAPPHATDTYRDLLCKFPLSQEHAPTSAGHEGSARCVDPRRKPLEARLRASLRTSPKHEELCFGQDQASIRAP